MCFYVIATHCHDIATLKADIAITATLDTIWLNVVLLAGEPELHLIRSDTVIYHRITKVTDLRSANKMCFYAMVSCETTKGYLEDMR